MAVNALFDVPSDWRSAQKLLVGLHTHIHGTNTHIHIECTVSCALKLAQRTESAGKTGTDTHTHTRTRTNHHAHLSGKVSYLPVFVSRHGHKHALTTHL